MSANALLDAALDYAQRGWRVLPLYPPVDGRCSCRSRKCEKQASAGKHPRTRHGFRDATTDETKIRRWWSMWPDSGIGIRTGDSLIVVDADPRNGGDQGLHVIEANHGELRTLTAATGRGDGGKHFYFTGTGIPCKTGVAPGIDVKGEGGYVVAPPSLHASGKPYRWLNDAEPQPVPPWFYEVAGERRGRDPREWDELAGKVIPEGARNNTLASVAGLLFRRLPAILAHDLALLWAQHRCSPPVPLREAERTLASIAGRELARRSGRPQ